MKVRNSSAGKTCQLHKHQLARDSRLVDVVSTRETASPRGMLCWPLSERKRAGHECQLPDVHVRYLHVEPHGISSLQDHANKGAGATQYAGPGGHAPDAAASGTGVTADNVVHTWYFHAWRPSCTKVCIPRAVAPVQLDRRSSDAGHISQKAK